MNRIETVCSLIAPCSVFADIGCDHGLVSLYAAENKLANSVYACDISVECVKKAEKLLSCYDNAFPLVSDGFSVLNERGIKVDQAVICGMGGELIIKILSGCAYKPILILGGQKNTDKLRVYLCANGYKIDFDRKIEERGKYYDIIRAVPGSMTIDDMQASFGVYYRQPNEALAAYYKWFLSKLYSYKQTEKNVSLINKIKEAEQWQR